MSAITLAAPFGGCNNFPSTAVAWRKAILLNRSVVISAFGRAFPAHDFQTLHLISPNPADAYWTGESWKRAAQSYHADRKRGL
jgi:hypothetical protein